MICRRKHKTSTHLIEQNNLLNNERNCRTIKTNKRNTNVNSSNIKKQMTEITSIFLFIIIGLYICDKLINND